MISDEAVEAAARKQRAIAGYDWDNMKLAADVEVILKEQLLAQARLILEAAAPHLMAQAWNEGFTDYYYLDRGYELDGQQDYELPSNLVDDVKVWNRYRPARG